MNPTFLYLFLFTKITILIRLAVSDTLIQNTKQSGKVMKTVQPSGIKMCAKYCFHDNRCRSFNFEKDSLSCEMLPTEDPSSYINSKGYLHSDIAKWSKDLAGSCETNDCAVDDRCVPLQNGENTCIKIGCVGIQYTYDDATGLCYHIFQMKKTWADASEYCQNEGGRLIVLDTQEKVNYFPPPAYNNYRMYIGLTDSEKEGTFKWVSGSSLVHDKWKHDQPNDFHDAHPGKSSDCVSAHKGFWLDDYCQHKQEFACERPDLSLR